MTKATAPTHQKKISRRNLLKTIAYGSVISVGGGLSSVASALSSVEKKAVKKTAGSALPTCDITIMQQQSFNKEIVSLMNHTSQTVTLDSITPVGLEHVNGSLVIRLNKVPNGKLSVAPGERLSFDIEATSSTSSTLKDNLPIPNVLAGHLQIKSEHPAFNGILPITVFDGQVT